MTDIININIAEEILRRFGPLARRRELLGN